mmetsp:Transcript_100832/g.217675  ORF Transcript_100832/g.217675 Transcript_100832/m.217675 type:complete len:265 (+) Transcript_100832:283-1077(+)
MGVAILAIRQRLMGTGARRLQLRGTCAREDALLALQAEAGHAVSRLPGADLRRRHPDALLLLPRRRGLVADRRRPDRGELRERALGPGARLRGEFLAGAQGRLRGRGHDQVASWNRCRGGGGVHGGVINDNVEGVIRRPCFSLIDSSSVARVSRNSSLDSSSSAAASSRHWAVTASKKASMDMAREVHERWNDEEGLERWNMRGEESSLGEVSLVMLLLGDLSQFMLSSRGEVILLMPGSLERLEGEAPEEKAEELRAQALLWP